MPDALSWVRHFQSKCSCAHQLGQKFQQWSLMTIDIVPDENLEFQALESIL